MLTGIYSHAEAAGLTHAHAAALPSTVDPIHNAPPATENHPGQQQRHHQHLRRQPPISTLKRCWKLVHAC